MKPPKCFGKRFLPTALECRHCRFVALCRVRGEENKRGSKRRGREVRDYIRELLLRKGSLSCSDLRELVGKRFESKGASITYHLLQMKRAGEVTVVTKERKWYYTLPQK